MSDTNPFKPGSNNFQDYETLSDLSWHCSVCELRAGQAKTWQTWRDEHGIQFEKGNPNSRNWDKRIFCKSCGKKTSHRKLKTLERIEVTSRRSGVSSKLAKRIKQIYGNVEAVSLRKVGAQLLEIDHRFPQIRWSEDEDLNEQLTDEELKRKFILLTRNDNLLKSRNCERCVNTGKRGSFPGIEFWYEGDENWVGDPHHEQGCVGCFWYDPDEWRNQLNRVITSSQNT